MKRFPLYCLLLWSAASLHAQSANIRLTAPIGGEKWPIGSSARISWTSSGTVSSVNIEMSRDGGLSYDTITSSAANTGQFNWTVTGPATAQARVRVSDADNPSVQSASGTNFSIGGTVLFQVNMDVQQQQGLFLPSSGDIVTVSGNFNSFSLLSDTLRDPTRSGIYSKSIFLPDSVGSQLIYKFWKTPRGGLGLESGPNRTYTIASVNDAVPLDFFNHDSTVSLPPPVPTLVAPANGSIDQSTSETLQWNASTGATSYHLQVALDASFSSIIIDDSTLSVTSLLIDTFVNSTTYYWRVSAISSTGTSPFSSAWRFTTVIAPPSSAPALATPVNGAVNQSINPTLKWNSIGAATAYRLQLSTNSTFTGLVVDNSSVSTTSVQVGPLNNSTTYYWRVAALNAGGAGPFSVPFTFATADALPAPPPAPVLSAPSNGQTKVALTPLLQWNASPRATSYRLQVSTNQSFTSIVLDDSSLAVPFRLVGPLAPNATFYWRVNASNTGGTSAFSQIWKFSTTAQPPPVPTLISPLDGSTNQPLAALTLYWSQSTAASRYHLQVAVDSLFRQLLLNDSTLTATQRALPTLVNGATYFWRVSASGSGGTSDYSTAWRFTTIPAPPPAPSLVSPISGATNQPTTILLNWSQVLTASSYHLRVSTSSTFSTTVLDDSSLTTTSRQIGPLSNNTTYYWRVSAKNDGGSGPFSQTWNFTTTLGLPAPPAIPTLVSPTDGQADQPVIVTLQWNAAPRATSYRLQVSTDASFGQAVVDDSLLSATSQQVGPLLTDTTYFWRVSASNAGGTSKFSTPWSFATIIDPPPVPTLLAPVNGATEQPTTLTLQWASQGNPSSFHLQVATDTGFNAVVVDNASLTSTSQQIGPLLSGTTYYWHVSAKKKGKSSSYSSTWNFATASGVPTVPSVPALLSPPNGSTNQPVSLSLSWNVAARATSYHLQVSTDARFSALLVDDTSLSGTSRQLNNLSTSTKHYWRVSASNAGGISGYSPAWTFTTSSGQTAVPAAPSLVTPANGSTNQPILLTLTWNPSAGAAFYRLQLSPDENFSTIAVDDSGLTSTSRQVGPLSNGRSYYWRVNARNVSGTGSFSPRWTFATIAAIVPTITPTVTPPTPGSALTISVSLPASFHPTTATLFYRNGGARAYGQTSFSLTGSQWESSIPSQMINLRGIEYYIHLSDGNISADYPRVPDPAAAPEVVTVQGISATSAAAFQPQTYSMISVPCLLSDSSLTSVLPANYGSYDVKRWRAFRWEQGRYIEYPNITTPMLPGNAFWIATANALPFSLTNARSLNSSRPYQIVLQPGWNQIGDPFAFPVAWSDIQASSSSGILDVQDPIYWSAEENDYQYNVTVLRPWEGYFVYNRSSSAVTVTVPPLEAAGSTAKLAVSPSSIIGANYALQLSASIPGSRLRDNWNFIGFADPSIGASPSILEAPPIGEYVRLSILQNLDRLASSFVPFDGKGMTWHMALQSTQTDKAVTISLHDVGNPPEGCSIVVLDEDRYIPIAVTSQRTFVVQLDKEHPTRTLRIIIGTEAYVKENSGGIPLHPLRYSLGQNYPNPFNPSTHIEYELGERSLVRLEIFNTLGERVRVLFDGEQVTGSHTVLWDGADDNGKPVSSGVYWCRMSASESISYGQSAFSALRKLLLLR